MSAWECPRCGTMNAIWLERCSCPPRTYVSTTTNLEDNGHREVVSGVAHGDPRVSKNCGRPMVFVRSRSGTSQFGYYRCPVHGRVDGEAWSYVLSEAILNG